MKQSYSTFSLVTVISLLLGVIWLNPARAAVAPVFEPLGQIRASGMLVVGAMDMDEAGTLYVADSRIRAGVRLPDPRRRLHFRALIDRH